jgi:putative transcriptional regulator
MDREKVAKKLLKLRGSRTRELVAVESGVSFRALESYESGYRTPRDSAKVKLAKYYGVSIQDLFYGE